MKKLVQAAVLSGALVAGASQAQEALNAVGFNRAVAGAQQDREKPQYLLYNAKQFWTSHRVDWYYNPSNQPATVSMAAALNAVQLAADRWSGMCNITFNYMGTTTAAPNMDGVSSTVDQKNVIGWSPMTDYVFRTKSWSSGSSMSDGDILISSNVNWAAESLDGALTEAIGHIIGIQLSFEKESVMYFMETQSTHYTQTLRGDDAAGCAALYGAAPAVSSNRVFNWAEAAYPQFLASGPAHSNTLQGYYYRYYASSRSYVATKDGAVFYMGPDGQIQNLGAISNFDAQVNAAGF